MQPATQDLPPPPPLPVMPVAIDLNAVPSKEELDMMRMMGMPVVRCVCWPAHPVGVHVEDARRASHTPGTLDTLTLHWPLNFETLNALNTPSNAGL